MAFFGFLNPFRRQAAHSVSPATKLVAPCYVYDPIVHNAFRADYFSASDLPQAIQNLDAAASNAEIMHVYRRVLDLRSDVISDQMMEKVRDLRAQAISPIMADKMVQTLKEARPVPAAAPSLLDRFRAAWGAFRSGGLQPN